MDKILTAISNVFKQCEALSAEFNTKLAEVNARIATVATRESRCTGIESAQAVLDTAKAITACNQTDKALLTEEQIKFENLMREERQAIKNEEGRLAPLQDAEKQLFAEKQALYAAQEALKIEKRDFAVRYIAKIKEHFKNTNGQAPNPDDIL